MKFIKVTDENLKYETCDYYGQNGRAWPDDGVLEEDPLFLEAFPPDSIIEVRSEPSVGDLLTLDFYRLKK